MTKWLSNPGQVLFLSGPTAVGKSDVALHLAEQLGGEIVSVDSMQVYRGLDLGTAKPSVADRARVPHHLIDVAGLTEEFDAAKYVELATAVLEDLQRRGKVALLCGGTGLYFNALLGGLGKSPPSDAALRAELETVPLPALLDELERRDPATFGRIDRQNPRRVVRAIEVIRLTGEPFSTQRAPWANVPGPLCFIGLARESADLHARINRRVDAMFAKGLVAEVRERLGEGLAANRTARQAIGYRQVIEHLRGERPLAETIALVKLRTRQFAKRQLTWFRRQLPTAWVPMSADTNPLTIAATVTDRFAEFRRRSVA